MTDTKPNATKLGIERRFPKPQVAESPELTNERDTRTSPRSSAGQSTSFLNPGSQVRDLPRTPQPHDDGPLQQRLRSVVVGELLPLLLDVAAGVAHPSHTNEGALRRLRLIEPGRMLRLSGLGRDVAQQLAALQVAGDLPALGAEERARRGWRWWASPLLDGPQLSPYGQHLLAWLRCGTMLRRCSADHSVTCCEAVAGVALRPSGVRVLACAEHRSDLGVLAMGVLDHALAAVPAVEVAGG